MITTLHKIVLSISLFFLLSIIGSTGTLAQISTSAGLGSIGPDFVLKTSPEIPGPNSNVNAKIESFSTDLHRADITWAVNGVVKKRGVAELNFSLNTGEIGSATTLTVTVETSDGMLLSKSRVFRPGQVDIIWQADS